MSQLRGLPPGFAGGINGSSIFHSSLLRSLGYGFLSFLSITQNYISSTLFYQLFRHALSRTVKHQCRKKVSVQVSILPELSQTDVSPRLAFEEYAAYLCGKQHPVLPDSGEKPSISVGHYHRARVPGADVSACLFPVPFVYCQSTRR
jgi:hypothetical protein